MKTAARHTVWLQASCLSKLLLDEDIGMQMERFWPDFMGTLMMVCDTDRDVMP